MIFTATELPGVGIIDLDPNTDLRGFFARRWCLEEFTAHGLEKSFTQANIAFNHLRGTLRGLHYNAPPHSETKLVRVTRGSAYAVVLDWRRDSGAYRQSVSLELSALSRRARWVPDGCAFGYQTLEDETELFYLMSRSYVPESSRGLRYNDPALDINWPLNVTVISDNDCQWPDAELS